MSELRRPLDEEQIADVFRTLADEYAGQRVALDRRRAELRMQAGQTFVEPAQEPSRAYRWLVRRMLPALAAAFFAWGVAVWLTPEALLEYTVEGATVQDGLIRTQDRPASIRFSDESAIQAGPRTQLGLEVVGERAALARLVKGDLRVAIQHEDDTDWRFLVGPYEVRVIGTQFDLAWEPDTAALSLVMREGKVRVVGPDNLDRVLVAGQRLDFARKARPAAAESVNSTPATATPSPAANLDASAAVNDSSSPSERKPVAAPNGAVGSTPRSWGSLVAGGRFEDVVREAQAEGIARAHSSRDAQDLRALAHAASYTGRTDLAIKTWNVVRQRFQGRGSDQAAFFLGRIFDQQGRHGEALTWLRTYLREAPNGVYASEALGAVLTLVRRTEGTAAAQPLARSYLERFPKGSYAAAARAVLDGQ